MSQQERWQLGGSAPETYERYLVPAIFAPWALLLIELATLRPGERVLDVACGTGVVTHLAAPHVGTSGQVVGLDLNPGMLAVARSLPAPQGATIDWREGDAGSLPFPEGVFDVVFCHFGFQYFADRQQASREMFRVLGSHGRLLASVWRALTHSPGFTALVTALERHVSAEAGAVLKAPFLFGDATEELRTMLSEAGFRTVRIRSDVRMVRFASFEAFIRHQIAGSPLAGHVTEANEGVEEALVREVRGAMRAYVNEEGVAFPIEGHLVIAHS